ncbi:MAG: lytic transglycosylase domain-containing protein [Rhizobiales bacterium]|nr:lytic transglycosylase domain-containing protein [Hyphomicrobiales bacterium]
MEKVSDKTAKTLIDWIYMRSPKGASNPDEIAAFMRANPDWPEPEVLRSRVEALMFSRPSGARDTIAYFNSFAPLSGPGLAALASAHLELGNHSKAKELVAKAWRGDKLSAELERAISKRCDCVTKALDKERLDRMAYRRSSSAMLRAAKRLDKAHVQLAQAHIAVAKRSRAASKQYSKVSASLKADTALQLSRATWLRRADKDAEARKLVLAAPRGQEAILDPKAWWTERRLLARRALGDEALVRDSYKLAAGHSLSGGGSYADAEFLAGWIALRRMGDAALAKRHFAKLRKAVDRPISVARAEYWLARADDKLGNTESAQEHRLAASRHGITFYGQLARNEIHGAKSVLDLPGISQEVHLASAKIEDQPLMRAARLLSTAGERWLAAKFLLRLARNTSDPGALDRIGNFANLLALPQVGVRVGKIGVYGGAPVHEVAYPVSDYPVLSPAPDVELALLLALTRQESEFAWQASSHAGARGLMQVMPATGKMLARQAGVPYSLKRLGEDPYYNASLGASFLADLVQRFDGSYVLAIASYNAGPGRVGEWIERFGDPRSDDVDVVDWIETIPFDETRNYVQRVLENLQVYRARLSGTAVPLRLAEDLARGRAGGRRAYAID